MQYVNIKLAIEDQIESGLLMPMQKLPAERKLAESFNTTRVTLREALSLLESEGTIFREDRRGWFISPAPFRYDPSQLDAFEKIAKTQNRRAETKIQSFQTAMADKTATKLLKLEPFADVHVLDCLRYLEGRPVAYTTTYVRTDKAPSLEQSQLEASSLAEVCQSQYGVRYSRLVYKVSTSAVTQELAHSLRATDGTPVLLVETTRYDQAGTAVDATIEYWRHDAVSIESMVDIN
ncbi:UTRA domain-containing protein [Vibrio sonorensis]|uniref:UTRA domain-containing protein n=1 Tax=Vibrio sonorensis TaxID=1004316 RepID=UPI0008DB093D|nr:UTRA domain-containing protein [Vibrio sonorensis]